MENFVTYDVASKLKEKGYEEPCMAMFTYALKSRKNSQDGYSGPFGWKKGECNFNKGYSINNAPSDYSNKYWNNVGAPLYQEVIEWFKGKHNIHIHPNFRKNTISGEMEYEYQVHYNDGEWKCIYISSSPDRLLVLAIEKALALI